MQTVEAVCVQLALGREELALWIERRWVRPKAQEGEHYFDAADVARARLIQELAHELSIDENAMPVILSLLDQLYAMRGLIKEMAEAVEDLPEPARSTLLDRVRAAMAEE